MCRGLILLRVRDMSHSYTWRYSWSQVSSYMWHGSFAVIPSCRLDIHRVTWRINMWHDSFIHAKWLRGTVQPMYATWIINSDRLWRYAPCNMMHSYVTHPTRDVTRGHGSAHIRDINHSRQVFNRVTRILQSHMGWLWLVGSIKS